ncbi:GntR family transcriptional regulator [Amycolatopsis magusensis]|uniref:GntR family transcriptional regulator n=1 Tax=Amycolatopsis magusensis TaxID=882444 RepID=UPI0024A7E50B|nr:GntR family transcriptional regulator [Amycolatopsis magusensis]MDI5982150.1 GntR family transcriptional regulator [Amycolatopsis magusensis]
MPRTRDTRPRHSQIAAELRARIISGDLAAGTQLPSTAQLMATYDAANATVQRALSALKDEGFLDSRVGKGVYVRDQPALTISAAAYVAPGQINYELLAVEQARPPADVAAGLGLDNTGTAVLRQRLLLRDGEPVELSYSYYPADIATGTALARPAKIPGGAPQILTDLGLPQRTFTDLITARAPTSNEVTLLDLPASVPVIRQFRVIHTDDQRPVEASVLIKGAHRYQLRYSDNAE